MPGGASALLDWVVRNAPYLDRAPAGGMLARTAFALLRSAGWRIVLAQPVPAKCVVVFYPHTSNWDFIVGLLTKWAIGLQIRWVGKDSMFVPPLSALFRRWGGIPVNRRERTGFIAQMQAAFAADDEFRLTIAPEGTRDRADHWKSGFWHLARAANVPVALAFIDYARREIGFGGHVDLSNDPHADIARMAEFYAGKTARWPELAGPIRLED